ncbi:MAG: copper chaperone PCu(A)C [Paracoccaceae bacterium]|nr:copper chaperone PCu(A)C [Paracoccaceae bacterium]
MSRQLFVLAMLACSLAIAVPGKIAIASGDQSHSHSHAQAHGELRNVPDGSVVPSIKLEAIADASDGYNLHLVVENFTFSPARIGEHSEAVEGHAHLYVNDVKIGRVYNTWVHLPSKLLKPGNNQIRVSLNDNTHRAWAHDGKAIEAVIMLTGTQASEGHGPIIVTEAWSRPGMPNRPAAVYLKLSNNSGHADQLIGVSSPMFDSAELHTTKVEGDVAKMSPVDAIEVPSNVDVELAPGGFHIMLFGAAHLTKEGDRFPLTLTLENAGDVGVEVEVMKGGHGGHDHGSHSGHSNN